MKIGLGMAVVYSVIMGLTIFFCRFSPFIFFADKGKTSKAKENFLKFIERTAPPVAMMVLTAYEIFSTVKSGWSASALLACVPVFAASAVTAGLPVWKHNALLSIFSGTILYMVLIRVL
jgi:branched-subunit amino acid transport protein AzlD